MRTRFLALIWTLLFAISSFAAPGPAPDFEKLARELTMQMAARHFESVADHFDGTMQSDMPSSKLSEFWTGLIGQAGAFQSITATSVQDVQGYKVVLATSKFEKTVLNLKWVFDADGHVAGFFVVPVDKPAPWSAPDYARPSSFHEEQVIVGDAPWEMSGTLTLPNGDGPFPAVVLVGGSGPEDKDETILSNKPFKDIAWGLASNKIAVLRYNKRTFQYGKELRANDAGFTVNEETVIDAKDAVALLAARGEIDPHRIYVLGHSLGAMVAPRIAQGNPQVAGLILLAGPSRPFQQVLVEQVKYISGLDGKPTPEAQKQIDAVEQAKAKIENPTLAADTRVNVLGSVIPGSYFLDLRGYRPVEVAAQLKIPMLILRGDRDYQVTQEDLDGWKAALAGKPGVTVKSYPGLYHLFMPSTSAGSGLGTPADYQKAGHVTPQVVDDIAGWVQAQAKPDQAAQ